MASATDTGNPERVRTLRRPVWRPTSKLGRLIVLLNLLGLTILIAGALVLNELRRGLVNARIDSLTTQGELIVNIIDRAATVGEPQPMLDRAFASELLQLLANPRFQRARLFDARGELVVDSAMVADRVERRELPAARRRGEPQFRLPFSQEPTASGESARAKADLRREVAAALAGEHVAGVRRVDNGERVVSVSIPIQHVKMVLGVLTLEASDVDDIVADERKALIPFILVAMLVMLASSLLLNHLVAHPVRRLAHAADHVRLSQARAISLPDIARRNDELGDLTRALEAMTQALTDRLDAIERFAADVAHEIRNPLTSLRSALETLDIVEDPQVRARLLEILKKDVQRLDRLVTDISNASRLDAELSREAPRPVNLGRLLADIVTVYQAQTKLGDVVVSYEEPAGMEALTVAGREGPFSQVFRNLIDNARSFSPPGGEVRVQAQRQKGEVTVQVDDDGPGIPTDNLENIFERFYTSRPKGAAFGSHSGLGLSIARQIVEAHNGRIHAENRIGPGGHVAGARFIVALPEASR